MSFFRSSSFHPAVGFHTQAGPDSNGRSFDRYLTDLKKVMPSFTAAQIFASNPKSFLHSGWTADTCKRTRDACAAQGIRLFIHAPYLINPCAWTGGGAENPDGQRIADLMVNLLTRGAEMGAEGVVMHVGKALKLGEVEGMRRMVAFCYAVLSRVPECSCRLLIETCAGQGSEIARNLVDFGALIHTLVEKYGAGAVGCCVDTCHVFTSGYGIEDLADRVAHDIGWEHVHLIHLNDSESCCGDCVDRHAAIGHGKIGAAGLAKFCTEAATASPHLAFVFETPSAAGGSSRFSEMAWFVELFSAYKP